MLKTYARIEAGAVAELLRTEASPAGLFHPALRWLEADNPAVAVGWVETAAGLAPPPASPPAAASEAPPTLAALHARVGELAARLAALTPR